MNKQELEPLEVPMPIYKHEGKELTNEELMKERSSAYEFINFDKQETLEEAIENRIKGINIDTGFRIERSYSEEEVNSMFDTLKENSVDNKITITNVDLFISSWKKQFKKK